jgi:NAD(P)-dependent dehydrogenase (short-subunit alcohol dehydrogenase family)
MTNHPPDSNRDSATRPLLAGKVAIVTGASRGIGAAAAPMFAEAGAAVALAARTTDALESVTGEIVAAGGQAIAVTTDVTEADAVERLVDRTVQAFGRLDVALNNAGGGISGKAALVDVPTQDLDRALELDLRATFVCMQHEIAAMLDSGGGAIVNVSSGAGRKAGAPGLSTYVAAKHGLEGLTKAAALDYAAQGVRVNAVAPGPIDTELMAFGSEEGRRMALQSVPLQRLGRPEDVAAAALWLCSEEASFICGAVLPIDGGQAAMG